MFKPLCTALFLVIALFTSVSGVCSAAPGSQNGRHSRPAKRADGASFVARASNELKLLAQRVTLADFTNGVDGTPEHAKALEQAQLAISLRGIALWKEALAYDAKLFPPRVARQLELLKLPPNEPLPFDKALAEQLASIQSTITQNYTSAQNCVGRPACRKKDELYEILQDSRDPAALLSAWSEWHAAAAAIRVQYARNVELLNVGARDFKQPDEGALLRSLYEMPPETFRAEYERLWGQLQPLYQAMHCHVRAKLHEHYGDLVPEHGLIPAHLLGNMWAQYWQKIDPLLGLPSGGMQINVTQALEEKKPTPREMVQTGEQFYVSLGFPKLPASFWQKSLFDNSPERIVDCHGSAWPIDPTHADVRLKMCVKRTEEDFRTVHHELGHIYYYLAYAGQPFLFQHGANPGFHEAIGDTIALSITPSYLKAIGLVTEEPAAGNDFPYLMRTALEKVPALALAMVVDTWRWKVYSGEISPDHYNEGWWRQVRKYQGLTAPAARTEKDFDAGMFYHISYGIPYDRYFIATLLQFDFHKALCQAAGYRGDLHRCSIYGSRVAGQRLQDTLKLGASVPWPTALEELTGHREIDASAMVDYFAPVMAWLKKQNEGRQCGWEE